MPYYSFVLLCHNNWKYSEEAITSLIASLGEHHLTKGVELIAVNNGSIDETEKELHRLKQKYLNEIDIHPIHLSENTGYPVGVNIGLSHCRGQIVTVINNDLIFPNNWFDGIVNVLENDASIGVAAPYLSYASGKQHVGVSFSTKEEMEAFSSQFMEEKQGLIQHSERVIGACLSIKQEVLKLVGGNDFWFGIGLFDDDDWTLRVGIAGYKCVIVGASFVHHVGTVTFNQYSDRLTEAFHANLPKFATKWNRTGYDHTNRKGIIDHTSYSKKEHYFPLRIEDFNISSDSSLPKHMNKKLLIVADWTNRHSRWKSSLRNILSKEKVENSYELYFWIPSTYFLGEEIKKEIEHTLSPFNLVIHYLFDDVSPVDLLSFMMSFHYFLEIDQDFVNLYLKNLVESKVKVI